MSLLSSVLAESGHVLVELPFPPIVFGSIAIIVFAALGLVMYSYKDVHRRHILKTDAHHPEHAGRTGHEVVSGGSGH